MSEADIIPFEDNPPPPPPDASGGRRFPCEQCGAMLAFDPGSQSLACAYCGHENAIPESTAEVSEQDFHAMLAQLSAHTPQEEYASVKCGSCGAEVDKPDTIEAMACPFCEAPIVDVTRSRRLIKPHAVLPFCIDAAMADRRFRDWLKGLWFAPNALKRFARIEKRLAGLYVPYWTFDSDTTSHYTGQRGDYYYVTVGTGKNQRRQRRTRWRAASGVVRRHFDDVLILASRSVPRARADALTPWDLKALAPYADDYLSGFRAERYQVELDEGFGLAHEVMDSEIRMIARQQIGGDEQRIYSLDIRHADVTFKHVLLPMWLAAYRFRGRLFQILVNGRTGAVQGDRPYSWVKITGAILAVAAVAGLIAWFVSQRQ